MSTDTTEKGLEALIVADMTGNGAAKTKGHDTREPMEEEPLSMAAEGEEEYGEE